MFSRVGIYLCFALAAYGATVRLYLKDGTYQMVREYEVKQDRVRFFSTEREEWEEIPLEMIDLARTKKEVVERDATIAAESKAQSEEDAALRQAAKEVEQVPTQDGVYYVHGDKLEPIKIAESKIVNNKRRSVLKALSPLPFVTGKQTLELDGDTAELRIGEKRPEFYFRLSADERFGIIKLTPTKKGARIVEKLEVIPVSKEVVETREEVDTFRKQVGDGLFKIWPEKDLDPGEYALIQYTDGKVNPQVWDFGVK